MLVMAVLIIIYQPQKLSSYSCSFTLYNHYYYKQETVEHDEHTYDHDLLRSLGDQLPAAPYNPAVASTVTVQSVTDALRRVFESHGALPIEPTLLRPKPQAAATGDTSSSSGSSASAVQDRVAVTLLDDRGIVVVLPTDLTAPFARFVARRSVANVKR
jgi:histidyl-tRNA synthetase